MTKYYYIPTQHETILANMVLAWLAQSPSAYVVCTGAKYEITERVPFTETVESAVMAQDKTKIWKSYCVRVAENEYNKYELLAFCLEGNLPAQIRQIALSLEGVKEFDLHDYIAYINEL
jgi:hypothetical protein